jgi:hypothetical protein
MVVPPTYAADIAVLPTFAAIVISLDVRIPIYSHVSHAIYYSYKLSTNNNYRGVTIAPY